MKTAHVSLLTALLSLLGSAVWLALGNVISGLVWLAISVVWLGVGIYHLRRLDEIEPSPLRKMARRFSRILLFWG